MNKEKVLKDIEELRENKSCSQSTLMGICKNADCDLTQEQLAILASGFGGGMGGTFDEGTCGALTGAIMALGLIGNDGGEISSQTKELFNKFKDKYSSVRCDVISKNGDDKSLCTECCLFAGDVVSDLIK